MDFTNAKEYGELINLAVRMMSDHTHGKSNVPDAGQNKLESNVLSITLELGHLPVRATGGYEFQAGYAVPA